jgi:hypothetical protein
VWEADPRHIAEDDPADAAVAATRCERAALHAVQEQVRRAAWAAAGLWYAHAAAWHVKSNPPGAGGGAAGDGAEEGCRVRFYFCCASGDPPTHQAHRALTHTSALFTC